MPEILRKHYCVDCGKEMWGRVSNGIPRNPRCRSCSHIRLRSNIGELNPHWKGGRSKSQSGYWRIRLNSNSPYYPMANNIGYVLEHRLLMAIKLSRCLTKSEHVHHINGIRDDNRIENLEIISPKNHGFRTLYCSKCELKKEIRLLRWQIKEQSEQIKALTSRLMGVSE